MALKKKVTLQNGFEGDYWKVTSALLDKQRLIVEASIGLFKNQELANNPQTQPAKMLNVKFNISYEQCSGKIIFTTMFSIYWSSNIFAIFLMLTVVRTWAKL